MIEASVWDSVCVCVQKKCNRISAGASRWIDWSRVRRNTWYSTQMALTVPYI